MSARTSAAVTESARRDQPDAAALVAAADDARPILLRGGAVVTLDPAVGELPTGDVLVRGNRIEAVAPEIPTPPDALVVDTTGQIVLPGLVDMHRHTWETVLRGVGGDWSLLDYFNQAVGLFGQHFRPEDVYAANFLAATESLDAGITGLSDWADASFTPDHAEAAAQALEDSGIRARFLYSNVYGPAQSWATTTHVEKMWARLGDPDGRVSMGLGIDSTRDPAFPEQAAWHFAREHGIPVTTHGGLFGWDNQHWIRKLADHNLLWPGTSYIHMVAVPDEFFGLVADSGGNIIMNSLSNMNSGQGYPTLDPVRSHGISISMGTDVDVRYRLDMFELMRITLAANSAYDHQRAHRAGHLQPYNVLRHSDVLGYATAGAARALGMSDRIGSLTAGKRADISTVRIDDRALSPRFNAAAHLVFQGTRHDVDTVLVDGRTVKYRGSPSDRRLERAVALAAESREYLISKIGEQAIRNSINEPFAPEGEPVQF
ncbi:amidohydrolase family protein [Nocardia arthritidis]|nr:amidohydrolase family protein [Nocardia arthritidis]